MLETADLCVAGGLPRDRIRPGGGEHGRARANGGRDRAGVLLGGLLSNRFRARLARVRRVRLPGSSSASVGLADHA